MQVWALVVDTFRETIEKKLFWINLLLSLLVALSLACISFNERGIDILFGWRTFEEQTFSTANPMFRSLIGQLISDLFVDCYIGWVGVILGLVCTAGIFPTMMERGSVDAIVARPLSRWKIFFAKYVGGLLFMFVQATFFTVLMFFVVGLRWKIWFPGILWSIPLLVLLFSYLYCLCVAFGLATRSGMASAVLTLTTWMLVIAPIQHGYETTHGMLKLQDWPRIKSATATLRWFVPNTTGIPRLVRKALGGIDPSALIPDQAAGDSVLSKQQLDDALEFEERMTKMPWYYAVGPSLLFEAVVLLLAGWRFSRKDF